MKVDIKNLAPMGEAAARPDGPARANASRCLGSPGPQANFGLRPFRSSLRSLLSGSPQPFA